MRKRISQNKTGRAAQRLRLPDLPARRSSTASLAGIKCDREFGRRAYDSSLVIVFIALLALVGPSDQHRQLGV
jgi:hypothetical protein